MSASISSTFRFPLLAMMSVRAASPFSLLRETITTVAPVLASPRAVALPIPEFPPVMRQVLPVISPVVSGKFHCLEIDTGVTDKVLSDHIVWTFCCLVTLANSESDAGAQGAILGSCLG